MSSRGLRAFAAFLPALLAGACASPPTVAPAPPSLPPAWDSPFGAADAPLPTPDWWAGFNSPELTRLIGEALQHNRELAAARSRLAQARARAGVTDAARAPSVQAGVGWAREKESGSASEGLLRADFSASYEIDLFGRQRQATEAALGRAQASAFAMQALRVSLQAEVASQYFQVLSLRDRLALARRSLGNAESMLGLLQTQQRAGTVSGLEVLRQRGLVASVQASLPPLERQLRQSLDALAVLTGRAPQGFAVAETRLDALPLPSVQPGLPAQLLQQRPDIRQAEAALAAAQADVASARAALFPTLALTAEAGAKSASLSTLLRSGSLAYAVGAGLVATLFDGGRRQSEVLLAQAQREELVAVYEQSILSALRDVEDALTTVARGAEQAAHQQQGIDHARAVLRMADLRYRNGAVDFSTVLDAQRVLLAAEDAQEAITLSRYGASVALFRALGGGWDAPPAATSSVAQGPLR